MFEAESTNNQQTRSAFIYRSFVDRTREEYCR